MLISRVSPYVAQAKLTQLGWLVIGFSVTCAACLLAGFMTPLIATTVAISATLLAVAGVISPPFEVIILAITVALLGPGAFSLDARMFGRREIFVPNTSRSSKS